MLASAAFAPTLALAAPTTIFFDDFAAEIGAAGAGLGSANFASTTNQSLANFTVTDGSLDLFTNTGFGLPCGSAGCLDLDGTTGNAARIETGTALSFVAGATYDITLTISGKNGGSAESLSFGLLGGPTDTFTSPVGAQAATTAVLSFTAAGSFADTLFIDHADGDNAGLLLDAVRVEESLPSTVPVPASLPLALAGLGLLAGIARRRG